MKRNIRFTIIGIVAMATLLLGCGTASADGILKTGKDTGSNFVTPTGSMTKQNSYSVDSKSITKLDLEIEVAQVQISRSTDEEIKLVLYANWSMGEAEKVHYRIKDHILEIEGGEWRSAREKGWLSDSYQGAYIDNRSQRLEIYLPESYTGSLEVEMDAAELNCSIPLKLSSLQLDLDAASAVFDKLELTRGSFDLDAGSVKASSITAETLTFDIDAGDAAVRNVKVSKSLNVECDAGTAEFEMAKDSAFTFQGKVSMGSLDTYFTTQGKDKNNGKGNDILRAVVGDGSASIKAEVDLGSLTFTKAAN